MAYDAQVSDLAPGSSANSSRVLPPVPSPGVVPAPSSASLTASGGDREIPTAFVGKLEPNYYCRGWNAKRAKYCRHRAGHGTEHVGVGRCKGHGGGSDDRIIHGQDRRYTFPTTKRIAALVEQFENDPAPLNLLPELALLRAIVVDFIERYDVITAALIAWHAERSITREQQDALYAALNEFEELVRSSDEVTDTQRETLTLAREAVRELGDDRDRPRHILDLADASRLVDRVGTMVKRIEDIRAQNAVSLPQLKRFLFALDRVITARVPDDTQRAAITRDILAIQIT